jgi:hypothetical protein
LRSGKLISIGLNLSNTISPSFEKSEINQTYVPSLNATNQFQSIRMFQCSKISNLFHHPRTDQELLCIEQNTQLDLFILDVNGEHLKIHDNSLLQKTRQLTLNRHKVSPVSAKQM